MKFCNIIDELQANIVGNCEQRINFGHDLVVNGLCQLFQREAMLLATAGYNCHKNMGPVQEGGTLMLAIDKINSSIELQTQTRTQPVWAGGCQCHSVVNRTTQHEW